MHCPTCMHCRYVHMHCPTAVRAHALPYVHALPPCTCIVVHILIDACIACGAGPPYLPTHSLTYSYLLTHSYLLTYLISRVVQVLLLEEIDKGLVLLGRAANIGIAELSYVSMTKTNHAVYPFGSRDAKVYPTSTEHGQLEGFLSVDMAIYKHFKSKFDEVWEARVTADHSLMDDLTLLQCMNQALADACHAPVTSDTKPSPTCHIAYLTDEVPYGLKFQSHGGTRAFAPEP